MRKKTFNGKAYHFYNAFRTKPPALKQATRLRGEGALARVEKEVYPDGVHWIIWMRYSPKYLYSSQARK